MAHVWNPNENHDVVRRSFPLRDISYSIAILEMVRLFLDCHPQNRHDGHRGVG